MSFLAPEIAYLAGLARVAQKRESGGIESEWYQDLSRYSRDSGILFLEGCVSTFTGMYFGSAGLSPASGFEHPASTLPTRFPAALGIGHDLPAA